MHICIIFLPHLSFFFIPIRIRNLLFPGSDYFFPDDRLFRQWISWKSPSIYQVDK